MMKMTDIVAEIRMDPYFNGQYVALRPEVKTQWLKALRSKQYPQGRKLLFRKTLTETMTYCCLGVACVVLGMTRLQGHQKLPSEKYLRLMFLPRTKHADRQRTINVLVYLNDRLGATFPQIATWIEKNL